MDFVIDHIVIAAIDSNPGDEHIRGIGGGAGRDGSLRRRRGRFRYRCRGLRRARLCGGSRIDNRSGWLFRLRAGSQHATEKAAGAKNTDAEHTDHSDDAHRNDRQGQTELPGTRARSR